MSSQVASQEELYPVVNSYEQLDCQLNTISIEELFKRYLEAGFLYTAKLEKLKPFWEEIKKNWQRGLRAGEMLIWNVTYESPNGTSWGALSGWRSTHTGWAIQHLISLGSPIASRAVMLSALGVRIFEGVDTSYQNWFRPNNKFANKVFGSLIDNVGTENAALETFNYFVVPLDVKSSNDDIAIVEGSLANKEEFLSFAKQLRGEVFIKAEALDTDDLNLETVDYFYCMVGLRRYRRIFLAYGKGKDELIGAAIVYRGPLGFNFSFLENRCDLLLSPALSERQADAVVTTLMQKVAPLYEDFSPQFIPVIACDCAAIALSNGGGEFIRNYSQSIWLKAGFVPYYRHLEKFYERIIRADKRRGVGLRSLHSSAREISVQG